MVGNQKGASRVAEILRQLLRKHARFSSRVSLPWPPWFSGKVGLCEVRRQQGVSAKVYWNERTTGVYLLKSRVINPRCAIWIRGPVFTRCRDTRSKPDSPDTLPLSTASRPATAPLPSQGRRLQFRKGKMRSKRGGDSTRSSNKKQKACRSGGIGNLHLDNTFEEEFGSLSDSGLGAWRALSKEVASNLAESVVSLASFDGNSMYFACTGIIIESSLSTTSFLTALSLVRSFDDDSKIFRHLKINVHLPNNETRKGWLRHYDLHHNIAVVSILPYPGLRTACLNHQLQFESHCQVVAIGRCFNSGKLMATTGTLIAKPSKVYREELLISTCEITMAGSGGPLIDLDGNFIGMNFYAKEMTPFLPREKVLECLVYFEKPGPEIKGGCTIESSKCEIQKSSTPYMPDLEGSSREVSKNKNEKISIFPICGCAELTDDELLDIPFIPRWPVGGNVLTDSLNKTLRSRGYPLPIFLDGETRFFACTGMFIDHNESATRVLTSASLVRTSDDENKIADNLTIEVCLPNKQHAIGTLQHYNLHYNIAVVSIMGFRCLRTAEIYDQMQIEPHGEVVAVGRGFVSGKLMVTCGTVTDEPSEFNCKEVMISTCKITKAGIGGPLIDYNGNFVGMNFYSLEKTPFVPRIIILKLLRHFDAKGTVACDFIDNCNPNRWPVIKPRWDYPSVHSMFDIEEPPKRQLL